MEGKAEYIVLLDLEGLIEFGRARDSSDTGATTDGTDEGSVGMYDVRWLEAPSQARQKLQECREICVFCWMDFMWGIQMREWSRVRTKYFRVGIKWMGQL